MKSDCEGDLAYAIKLLASGQAIDEVWREAGFTSRKALAGGLYQLSAEITGKAKPHSVVVFSDGASSGNPGEAGCGVVIVDESGEVLLEDYRYLGRKTNNVAEYMGAILGLTRAHQMGATRVELRVDSSLLANQIKGGYKVKSQRLAHLYQDLMKIVKSFEDFTVTLINRSENKQADRLANLAISAR